MFPLRQQGRNKTAGETVHAVLRQPRAFFMKVAMGMAEPFFIAGRHDKEDV